jgi:hypothetical protein
MFESLDLGKRSRSRESDAKQRRPARMWSVR